MRVLHLTLKKKWFDMILSGEKKEEYREIKAYWANRLWVRDEHCGLDGGHFSEYDIVRFRNGYSPTSPVMDVEFKGVRAGMGKREWGAEKESFIISLGSILSTKNIPESCETH